MCEGLGHAIAFVLSPGQRHESVFFEALLTESFERAEEMGAKKPKKMAGDKAYRAKRIRNRLADEHIEALIPPKVNEKAPVPIDKEAYRGRNVIERLIGWLKHWRAVATRYDKLARNYAATLTVALIERCLRATPL